MHRSRLVHWYDGGGGEGDPAVHHVSDQVPRGLYADVVGLCDEVGASPTDGHRHAGRDQRAGQAAHPLHALAAVVAAYPVLVAQNVDRCVVKEMSHV